MKEKCINCDKIAVWVYMPSSPKKLYYCDDCITKKGNEGCSCNHEYLAEEYENSPKGIEGIDWIWLEGKKDIAWQPIDEKGRPYPCCEFWYYEEGYDKNN